MLLLLLITLMEGVRGSGDLMEGAAVVAGVLTVTVLVGLAGSRGRAKFPTGGRGTRLGCKTLQRTRRSVEAIFGEIGATTVRRMYRMTPESFWNLHQLLERKLENPNKRKRGKAPNGLIPSDLRLAMALRYMCGGDPYDIALSHGVHSGEVKKSCWMVVDAVNKTESMAIQYPVSHDDQVDVAKGFQKKSTIDLWNCAGAIDGMLIWIQKPSQKDVDENIGFGEGKFLCGRKGKFGLNLQAVCDAKNRFLDVSIGTPGSSSDYFTFLHSKICDSLETEGFLKPGLCLYGDNAYCNNSYMMVPFKGNVSGSEDAYNFFHSSLRINIECAFGMLVHRFGILRKPMPVNIRVPQTSALVTALCRLHNYCIDRQDTETSDFTPKDLLFQVMNGGSTLPVGRHDFNYNPEEDRDQLLLDGGSHFQDVVQERRRMLKELEDTNREFPYKTVLQYIQESHFERPSPHKS